MTGSVHGHRWARRILTGGAVSLVMIALAGIDTYVRSGDRAIACANAGRMDDRAPIRAETGMDMAASPATVWSILANIDQWPRWQPELTDTRLDGPLRSGTVFTWDAGGTPIRSTLRIVDRPRRLIWTGHALGLQPVHVWTIEARAAGRTHVEIQESMAGFPASLFYSSSELAAADTDWLRFLKAVAEQRPVP